MKGCPPEEKENRPERNNGLCLLHSTYIQNPIKEITLILRKAVAEGCSQTQRWGWIVGRPSGL